jgi:hypothetical protein
MQNLQVSKARLLISATFIDEHRICSYGFYGAYAAERGSNNQYTSPN